MLQRNPNPWPVTLPEYREPSGTVHPTVSVEAGAEIDWPITIGGFENLTPAETATEPEAAPTEAVKAPAKASGKTASTKAEGVTA